MTHTFVNVFEFGGEVYRSEAVVVAEEEDIGFWIDPEIPDRLDDAVQDFLGDWLREVVACHVELRKTVV